MSYSIDVSIRLYALDRSRERHDAAGRLLGQGAAGPETCSWGDQFKRPTWVVPTGRILDV